MTVPLVTRVLIADDHPIVRRGLRELLDPEPDLRVVAEVADGAAAVRRALADDVDLAILDVAMPRLTGLQAARELAQRRPQLRLLILSMHENEQFFSRRSAREPPATSSRPRPTGISLTPAAAPCADKPFFMPAPSPPSPATTSIASGGDRVPTRGTP